MSEPTDRENELRALIAEAIPIIDYMLDDGLPLDDAAAWLPKAREILRACDE